MIPSMGMAGTNVMLSCKSPIDIDDQASQGRFHLPSSMEDFSPSFTMDVTSEGSGAESDISQQCVSGSRWHV